MKIFNAQSYLSAESEYVDDYGSEEHALKGMGKGAVMWPWYGVHNSGKSHCRWYRK